MYLTVYLKMFPKYYGEFIFGRSVLVTVHSFKSENLIALISNSRPTIFVRDGILRKNYYRYYYRMNNDWFFSWKLYPTSFTGKYQKVGLVNENM